MELQYEIMTDTAAEIPWRLIEKDELDVISMPMMLDNVPFKYNSHMPSTELYAYYQALADGKSSTTAQIAPQVYQEAFQKSFERNHDVLYIGFSSGMSGSLHNASFAAKEVMKTSKRHRVVCIDSLAATVSQTLLLLCALANRRLGMDLMQNANWLLGARKQIHVCFSVDDMNYLLRGGRISKAQAFWGSTLHIHPLLQINEAGMLQTITKVRGDKGILRAMIDRAVPICKEQDGAILLIGHTDMNERTEQLMEMIRQKLPAAEIFAFPVGPVVTCHTGPQMMALAYCEPAVSRRAAMILKERDVQYEQHFGLS